MGCILGRQSRFFLPSYLFGRSAIPLCRPERDLDCLNARFSVVENLRIKLTLRKNPDTRVDRYRLIKVVPWLSYQGYISTKEEPKFSPMREGQLHE